MEGNPYEVLARQFARPDPADGLRFGIGAVTKLSPLAVQAFGVSFSGETLRVNAQLISGWTQDIRLTAPKQSIAGTETVTRGTLACGDQVACIINADPMAGNQVLYVLAKVVSG